MRQGFSQPKLRDDIMNAIAEDVNGSSSANRGRKGNGYQERLKTPYRELLGLVQTITARAEKLRHNARNSTRMDVEALALEAQLEVYLERTLHVSDSARRRVLHGEQVPTARSRSAFLSRIRSCTSVYKRGKAGHVLGRNLHVLGKLLIARQDASSQAGRSQRRQPAA